LGAIVAIAPKKGILQHISGVALGVKSSSALTITSQLQISDDIQFPNRNAILMLHSTHSFGCKKIKEDNRHKIWVTT
jgi:hypothetical protein